MDEWRDKHIFRQLWAGSPDSQSFSFFTCLLLCGSHQFNPSQIEIMYSHLLDFSYRLMRLVTTFWPTMDHVYNSGPIRWKWSGISYKKWKDMWLRRKKKRLFSVGLGGRFSHSQDLNFERTDYIIVSQRPTVSAQRNPVRSLLHIQRALQLSQIWPDGPQSTFLCIFCWESCAGPQELR